MKRLYSRLFPGDQKGQSLVELMIVTPLLIFLMIGVFEVGWALRGYLVLINVNREITRFAVRPGYMDFSSQASVITSTNRIRDWVDTSLSGQLDMDFKDTGEDGDEANTTLIISHLVVDTGFPCVPDQIDADCTCLTDAAKQFPQDDLIIHPQMAGFEYQTASYGRETDRNGNPIETRLNYSNLIDRLTAENDEFNCRIINRGGNASANNVIVTELLYEQPQLFGFPIVSNPLTDPVPLYAATTMRLIGAARSTGRADGDLTKGIESIGPVCFAYPMLIDGSSSDFSHGRVINAVEDGWLMWNNSGPSAPITSEEEYISFALQFPQMSVSNFEDAGGGPNNLEAGVSQVRKVTAQVPGAEDVLIGLVNRPLIIPYSNAPGASPVQIDGFVWATIGGEGNINLGTGTYGTVTVSLDMDFERTPLPEACQ